MTDDRIKAAAKWAKQAESFTVGPPASINAAIDAAHILSLLASGKAVLCEAEGRRFDGLTITYAEALHAPLDPWSTTCA